MKMYRFSEPDLESWAKEAGADSVGIQTWYDEELPGDKSGPAIVVVKGHKYVAVALPQGVDEFPAAIFRKAKYAFERAER